MLTHMASGMKLGFEVLHKDASTSARLGVLHTPHGDIRTPVFMPVGTAGAVKATSNGTLESLDARIILGNTYHLYLRPGHERIERLGGLHEFMSWNGAILTDSGGYQVFSHRELRSISEEGVQFRSHLDGSKNFFTPEKVVDIQRALGSDIAMVLDDCTAYPTGFVEAEASMELSGKKMPGALAKARRREPGSVRHRSGERVSGLAEAVGGSSE
jgi:queuine tRNA-ribosyltransferase